MIKIIYNRDIYKVLRAQRGRNSLPGVRGRVSRDQRRPHGENKFNVDLKGELKPRND